MAAWRRDSALGDVYAGTEGADAGGLVMLRGGVLSRPGASRRALGFSGPFTSGGGLLRYSAD